jgi:site-specific recombinase XerD
MTALAPSLQAYFTDRLIGQRAASPNTIAAYRLTFCLLLRFASQRTGKPPSELDIAQLDAPLIAAFLEHLQQERGNSAATRNNRLAAIHSLFAYLALHHPEHAATIQRVLAIPPKRTERNLLAYLTEPEVDALLAACDQAAWTGRRDHAMLALTIQAGLRISELAGLVCQDITLAAGANVHTIGKGRKERRTPLTPPTKATLNAWLRERAGAPEDPLFPDDHRQAPQPRRDRTAPRPPRGRRRPDLPVNHHQAGHDAHAAAHRRDAPPARRQRHHRDRPLARPRADLDHQHLPARRHDPQAASDRPHQAARRQARALPAPRYAHRLPRSALIMPTAPAPKSL